jgi:selenide,water dikinase
MTDVTGFGLLGHALPIAKNARVMMTIHAESVPLFSEARNLTGRFFSPQTEMNKQYVNPYTRIDESVSSQYFSLLAEPQTSGGLLATVAAHQAEEVISSLHKAGDTSAAIIGEIHPLNDTNAENSVFIKVIG